MGETTTGSTSPGTRPDHKALGQPSPNPRLQTALTARWEPPGHDLLIQDIAKAITVRHRTIGPGGMTTGLEKLSLLGQGHAPRLHVLLCALQPCCHRGNGKFHPGDTSSFEETLVLSAALRQLLRDQRLQRRRNHGGTRVYSST